MRRLEDEAAIRALHRGRLQRVNAGDTEMAGLVAGDGAARCLNSVVCELSAAGAQDVVFKIAAGGSEPATGSLSGDEGKPGRAR